MDKDAVLEIMSRFKRAIEAQNVKVHRMILFGSQVTGKAREGSDIDVLVISDDFKDKGYWERIDILSAAIYEVFEPIEAIAMTTEEWSNGTSPVADYVRDGAMEYAV
jgi:predicted nucleotidyltransferase